ncbi:hypothetical protein K7X08_014970 [Anisodus acutangulus]|uniref:Uncharacterized protein n=1 Tax=Anisodus acutangulus TaxID=402998 RepID=A0A9Q1QT69_9SOLA|nr:hypothetical protein K7X08_014970 [Anisodus acutangulus]
MAIYLINQRQSRMKVLGVRTCNFFWSATEKDEFNIIKKRRIDTGRIIYLEQLKDSHCDIMSKGEKSRQLHRGAQRMISIYTRDAPRQGEHHIRAFINQGS